MKGLDCMLVMLGGAVVGATAALLLAPYSGKEMRKRVCHMMKKKGMPCCKEELDKLVEEFEGDGASA